MIDKMKEAKEKMKEVNIGDNMIEKMKEAKETMSIDKVKEKMVEAKQKMSDGVKEAKEIV